MDGSASDAMETVVGSGDSDTSSKPRRDGLLIPLGKVTVILLSATGNNKVDWALQP